MRPYRSSTRATVRSTAAWSATSQAMATASPPARAISAASASSRSTRRATSATRIPRAARSRASCAPIPLEAPVTRPTVPRQSVSPGIGPARREAQREADQAWDEAGSQQPRIVAGEPALVLADADVTELAQRHFADRFRHLHREVVAGVGVAQLERRSQPADGLQRHAETAPQVEPRLAGDRQLQPSVRHPVREEEDVPCLLLHDTVEDADQRGGEDAGLGGHVEEPEGEEGVEALPVAHAEETPLGVPGLLARRVGHLDAVVRREALEQEGVTALLVGLHRDRLAEQRVALHVGHSAHARPRRPLAANRLAPERERTQALEVRLVELGPLHVAHLVGVERAGEFPAEEQLVLFAADLQVRHGCGPIYRAP